MPGCPRKIRLFSWFTKRRANPRYNTSYIVLVVVTEKMCLSCLGGSTWKSRYTKLKLKSAARSDLVTLIYSCRRGVNLCPWKTRTGATRRSKSACRLFYSSCYITDNLTGTLLTDDILPSLDACRSYIGLLWLMCLGVQGSPGALCCYFYIPSSVALTVQSTLLAPMHGEDSNRVLNHPNDPIKMRL